MNLQCTLFRQLSRKQVGLFGSLALMSMSCGARSDLRVPTNVSADVPSVPSRDVLVGDACVGAGCIFDSCREILQRNPASPNGVYTINPRAQMGVAAFEAYCDMTRDGGGWTLVLMASRANPGRFGYDSPAWIDDTVVAPEITDPTRDANVKSPAFLHVYFTSMRMCLGTLEGCVIEQVSALTARAHFTAARDRVSPLPVSAYRAWGYDGSLGCNLHGFDVHDLQGSPPPLHGPARIRYGILLNNEPNCEGSVDGGRGFGIKGYFGAQISAGKGDGIVGTEHMRGWIFVR